MKGRGSSPSVLLQVAALAVLAVIASQAVTFIVIVTSPPPMPAGFSAAAAADAALGKPAETSDGRELTRRLSDKPGVREASDDPIAALIAGTVARRAGVPVGSVRVAVDHEGLSGPGGRPRFGVFAGSERFTFRRVPSAPESTIVLPKDIDPAAAAAVARKAVEAARRADQPIVGANRITIRRTEGGAVTLSPALPLPPGAIRDIQVVTTGPDAARFNIVPDRLTFRPFSTSVRLPDGRWSTVHPPRGLIDPWQARVLISLLISMALLAPLVWLLARRLTRPIRVFAEAAQRLGADPDAAPLRPSGPAEVRTAIAAFNDMQASLRDHMRKRTQTIAAIAHDLRTPLTRLRFRAEQAPNAVRDRMAADIEEMDDLIAQAMSYVRGETPSRRQERLDLAALAAGVASGFSETGAAVTSALPEPLPVEADPDALRRALSNLIGNAVKYGGMAEVSGWIDGDVAVIQVADRGPGLAGEVLEDLFEPFHRGEASRNRDTGGTGLGLTVTRQAARAAGGDVILENRPGGGLIAALRLPSAR